MLCGINARFTHSNLALLCLKKAASDADNIHIAEFSINDRVPKIVSDIVQTQPDAVGFSCYIWNIEHVLKTASTMKKIMPQCFIIFGGPEVSFNSAELMKKHAFIDMIIKGQGEVPFGTWYGEYMDGGDITATPSACVRTDDQIYETAEGPPYDMSGRPFVYGDLAAYTNRTIYYETSRGCPFNCAYCMSANERMAYVPIDRVRQELEFFFKAGVRQVKLVDRTFNFPPKRGQEIVKVIIELSKVYPQALTNFHMEISACLLDEETMVLLRQARKDLIQLEIGIQSTNPDTLAAVGRTHNTDKLLDNTRALAGFGNIHVHADLIAGLPSEDYETFQKSFNDAYSLHADALQLGFLKVLKGSPLYQKAGQYGIVYTEYAPYEVLKTHAITYEQLAVLHLIARIVDTLYNTGHANRTLAYIVPRLKTPFAFYERFALYLKKSSYFEKPQKKKLIFEMLYQFAAESKNADIDCVQEAIMFDWLCLEKPRSWPKQIEAPMTPDDKKQRRDFFGVRDNIQKYLPAYQNMPPAEIEKRCFICEFSHMFDKKTKVLFDYGKQRCDDSFCQFLD